MIKRILENSIIFPAFVIVIEAELDRIYKAGKVILFVSLNYHLQKTDEILIKVFAENA